MAVIAYRCKIHCIFFQDKLEKVTQMYKMYSKGIIILQTELQTLFLHKLC